MPFEGRDRTHFSFSLSPHYPEEMAHTVSCSEEDFVTPPFMRSCISVPSQGETLTGSLGQLALGVGLLKLRMFIITTPDIFVVSVINMTF